MPVLTVLHVLEAVAHGTGRHLVDLCAALPDIEHHAVLPASPTGRGETRSERTAERLVAGGVTVHPVRLRRNPLHPDTARGLVAVRSLIRRLRPDVVHGHAAVGGAVARLAALGTGVPTVYTPNGLRTGRAVLIAERLLGPLTGRLVAVSASEAAVVHRHRLAHRDRVRVVPNGIPVDPRGCDRPSARRDLRASLGVPHRSPLVGFVGRLARQKAPEVLVDAAALLAPEIHVVLVGGGPAAARVRERVRRRGLADRVHLPGHMDGAAGLLGDLDVLALPSRWEGAPYVPLEAFRAGTPVVATDVVGSRDVVDHGASGLVVPPDDPPALAAALERVLGDDRLCRRLVEGGDHALRERFSRRRMGVETRAVYRELVGPSGRRRRQTQDD